MTARATASMRARSRGEASPSAPSSRASTCSTIVVAVLAQRADRRQRVQLAEPAGEALDLLLDDLLARAAPRLARELRLRATTACRSSMS